MLKKRVTGYTAEKITPDCVQLKNRGAIIGYIIRTNEGWKVTPLQAGRRPSRRPYPTAADAAEKYYDKSAAQAVQLVEPGNHDEPETVTA